MGAKKKNRARGADELSDRQERLVEQFLVSQRGAGVTVLPSQAEQFKRWVAKRWNRRALSEIVSKSPPAPGRKRVLIVENDRDVARGFARQFVFARQFRLLPANRFACPQIPSRPSYRILQGGSH